MNVDVKTICGSPYVYGADIKSTSLIKYATRQKYPDTNVKLTLAVFDTETDVVDGTEKTTMGTISSRGKVYTYVAASFVEGIPNIEERLAKISAKHLDPIVKSQNFHIDHHVEYVKDDLEVFRCCFNKAHEIKPDLLVIWNMVYDIEMFIKTCEAHDVNPADIACDPRVPKDYRFFTFKKGPDKKVMASGKEMPIKMAAQWHTVFVPASFYIIDAMCVYRHTRTGQPEEPSYALDYILKKNLKFGKLEIEEAKKYAGLRWHYFMQTRHKLEYIVYNGFDCISIEMLDEITMDMSIILPLFAGYSDFEDFKSQPRRLVDDMHFYLLSVGKVIATTGRNMREEGDSETVSADGWVTTLPANGIVCSGLCIIKEDPTHRTNYYPGTYDLDVAGAYPTNQMVMSVSKKTTIKERIKAYGVSEHAMRMQGLNLSGGQTNALEFCQTLFGYPSVSRMQQLYLERKKQTQEQMALN
jgi:hypothetical protein